MPLSPTAPTSWPPRARARYWRLKFTALALLMLGFRRRAHIVLCDLLKQWPTDADALASRAHLGAQLGHREQALSDAQALVDAHPRRAAADWFNLAFLLEQDGQADRAESAFRRALELDPTLDRAWYGLGLTLIRLQRADEAIGAFERTTELQPMSPHGWYQLARLHADLQRPDDARRIIGHLKTFEAAVAARLEHETGLTA